MEDGGTQLEYAADQCTDQLLSEMSPDPLTIPDLQAYICWYCARPFIGRGSFYIHLLQEAMALPGKPSKCCLINSALPSPLLPQWAERSNKHICEKLSTLYCVALSYVVVAAGGLLNGLEFSDISQQVDCLQCEEKISLIDLQKHLTDNHSYTDNQVSWQYTCTWGHNEITFSMKDLSYRVCKWDNSLC